MVCSETKDDLPIGSKAWLEHTEVFFGGVIKGVPRVVVSEHDPRPVDVLKRGGMQGGDRMVHHGYAHAYAFHLRPFSIRNLSRLNLLEVGILKGTGLALWSLLFPNARLIGFDIDIGPASLNIPPLHNLGAFQQSQPELYKFDQFKPDWDLLTRILKDQKLDIVVDDGCHIDEAIYNTAKVMYPFLNSNFVYVIEDNKTISMSILEGIFPKANIYRYGELTVIERWV